MAVHITGTMGLPSGAIYPNCEMYFERKVGVVSQSGYAVVPEKTIVRSNASAAVDFYLLYGEYIGTIQTTLGVVKFAFSVLDVASATFLSCIGSVSVPIPADSVQQALDAANAAVDIVASQSFANRAEAQAATIDVAVNNIFVMHGKLRLAYVYDATGSALTTADGRKWLPLAGTQRPEHWADNTTPGTTNMTAAFLGALFFAKTNGKNVDLMDTSYALTANAITIGTDVVLRGAGREATTLIKTDADGVLIDMTGARAGISHLKINSSVTQAGGVFIKQSADTTIIDNVRCDGFYQAIWDSHGGLSVVSNCIIWKTQPSPVAAHYVNKTGVATRFIANTYSTSDYSDRYLACLHIDKSNDITVTDCQFVGGEHGVLLGDVGVGTGPGSLKFSNCFFDNCGTAALRMTSQGKFERSSFVNCWFGNNEFSATGKALWIEPAAGGEVNNVEFIGCQFLRMNYGIYLKGSAVQNVRFIGGSVAQNTTAGIYIDSLSRGYIRGMKVGPTRSPFLGNAIGAIITGTFTDFSFEDNDLTWNITAAIDDSGLVGGVTMRDNKGVDLPDRGPDGILGKNRQIPHCVVGGTGDAVTLKTYYTLQALAVGQRVCWTPTLTNTGAATVVIDDLASVPIKTVTGAALPAGYIRVGVLTEAHFDGTNFIVDRKPEVGDNANGTFEKYADGTMECKSPNFVGIDVNTTLGSGFQSTLRTWTLPLTYASDVIWSGGSNANGNAATHFVNTRVASATTVEYALLAFTSVTGRGVRLWASGKWY